VTRRIAVLALSLVVVALLAGCGEDPPVPTTETAGTGTRLVRVLVEPPALSAVRSDIRLFVGRRAALISSGAGTADAIAATVKHGYRIDVVVLRSGPALDRVRDELLAPPVRLGRLGSTTYWACAISRYGQPFVQFLTGPASRQLLRTSGFDVSP
jgi:hypothetical protein